MQPDHDALPPAANSPTEPTVLDDLVALTSLFNPETLWHEEEKLDALDEQELAQKQAATASPAAPTQE